MKRRVAADGLPPMGAEDNTKMETELTEKPCPEGESTAQNLAGNRIGRKFVQCKRETPTPSSALALTKEYQGDPE